MLFFLRKLMEALLLPIGLAGLLTLIAVVLRRRLLAVVAVAVLYFLAMPAVGVLLLRPLERAYAPLPPAAAPQADAVVVLSGGILRGKNPAGVQWENSATRFFAGVDLALARKARFLILSAGIYPPHAQLLRQVAIRDGVPPAEILLTPAVSTTEEEAQAVSRMPGIHSILLVTSAFHMPRAVLLFRARGFEVFPFPTDQRTNPYESPRSPTAFIPAASALFNSEAALREYYGLFVYRTMYLFR